MGLNTPNFLRKNWDEKQLYRLSLLFAVIGLLTLAGSAEFLKPDHVPVSEITRDMNGEKIRTTGIVHSPRHIKGHLFFDLKYRGDTIKAVEFSSDRKLNETEKVNLEGAVTVYQGELEIVADRIETAQK